MVSNDIPLSDQFDEIIKELKPCPLCGSPPTIQHRFSQKTHKANFVVITCSRCRLQTRYFELKFKPRVLIEHWNTRKDV